MSATAQAPGAGDDAYAGVPRIGRGFRLQWEEAQGAWVLLYPEGMVKLNGSAGEILKRCDGVRSGPQIVADLEQAFGVAGLAADVRGFLAIALRNRWIEVQGIPPE